MNQKDDVTRFWEATAAKFNDTRKFHELTPQQQQVFMQGINNILAVMHRMV